MRRTNGMTYEKQFKTLQDAANAACAQWRETRYWQVDGVPQQQREIVLNHLHELPFRRDPDHEIIWTVVSGYGHADIDETEIVLAPGSSIRIAPNVLHQVENRFLVPLVMVERRETLGAEPGALTSNAA